MILGIDCSTSIVGLAILQLDGKLGSLDFINLKKEKSLFEKAMTVHEHLKQYKDIITEVAIEEPLVMFKPGLSRAQVLSRLSMFNGMAAIVSFMVYNREPVYYNVSHARKLALPDLRYPQGSNRKQLVFDAVDRNNPGIVWPKKRTGANADQCFDMADAYVVAKAHWVTLSNR